MISRRSFGHLLFCQLCNGKFSLSCDYWSSVQTAKIGISVSYHYRFKNSLKFLKKFEVLNNLRSVFVLVSDAVARIVRSSLIIVECNISEHLNWSAEGVWHFQSCVSYFYKYFQSNFFVEINSKAFNLIAIQHIRNFGPVLLFNLFGVNVKYNLKGLFQERNTISLRIFY